MNVGRRLEAVKRRAAGHVAVNAYRRVVREGERNIMKAMEKEKRMWASEEMRK